MNTLLVSAVKKCVEKIDNPLLQYIECKNVKDRLSALLEQFQGLSISYQSTCNGCAISDGRNIYPLDDAVIVFGEHGDNHARLCHVVNFRDEYHQVGP